MADERDEFDTWLSSHLKGVRARAEMMAGPPPLRVAAGRRAVVGVLTAAALTVVAAGGVTLTLVGRHSGPAPVPAMSPTPLVSPAVVPPQESLAPSPSATAPPAASRTVLYTTGYGGSPAPDVQLHELTIAGGVTSDRLLLHDQSLVLVGASRTAALVTIGQLPEKLALLDLRTGGYRFVPIATDYGTDAVFSPDGSEAVLSRFDAGPGTTWFMVDPASGRYRQLTRSGGPTDLVVMRWTSSGILAAKASNDDGQTAFWHVDPQSWHVTAVSSSYYFPKVSPDGAVITSSPYVPLGDSPCQCQVNWINSISVTHLGGVPVQVIAQRNRDFAVDSVGNDGSVLFTSDNGTAAFTQAITADAGMYLASDGPPRLQFRDRQLGQWNSGTLLSSSEALLTQTIGNRVEVDFAHLCGAADTACTPSFTRVSLPPMGPYPFVGFLALPQ